MARLKQILIAMDQLANTLAGGWADETLSARAWRLRFRHRWGIIRAVIDRVFFWDRDHCRASFEAEFKRQQMPQEYRSQP
jgi:hypothetical protein